MLGVSLTVNGAGKMTPSLAGLLSIPEPEARFKNSKMYIGLAGVSSRGLPLIVIIMMYSYRALINALSTHMIHINLNTILCTHVPKQVA